MSRYTDLEHTFAVMDDLRRRMDRLFFDIDAAPARAPLRGEFDRAPRFVAPGPRVHLYDVGKELVIKADLPGMSEKDLSISLNQDVLTLSGERRVDVPQGFGAQGAGGDPEPRVSKRFTVHRQERPPVRFSRSFTLPTKVDAEATKAVLKNGVLMLTLPKMPEAQPRKITVQAQ